MSEILIVVPARGGSKRVPRKNITPLGGMPLLEWTLIAAKRGLPQTRLIVSTEDDEIARLTNDLGVQVIKRPVDLATDIASTEGVLLHVIDSVASDSVTPDWVMCLPPSSPFRSPDTIAKVAQHAGQDDLIDCYFTVTESRGDFWRPAADGVWRRMEADAPRRQQDREPLYEENSAIYLTRISALRQTNFIMGSCAIGIPMDQVEATDINTPKDIQFANALITAGLARTP